VDKIWIIVILPPVLAVMIVPDDGNYVTHLMEYSLGFFGALFAFYGLGDQDDKH